MIALARIAFSRTVTALGLKTRKRFDFPIRPRNLNFVVTYRCNSRCMVCDIWKKYQDDSSLAKEELTLEEIKNFFQQNKSFLNRVTVGLTGGEPFLRRDLVKIIKVIRETIPAPVIGIQTNGLTPELIQERLREVKKIYPKIGLGVSLDGIGETHDRVRGVKGAFEKALKTIEYARGLDMGWISTGMTITPWNYKEVLKVRHLAEKYGCEFSCFLPDSSDYFGNKGKSYELSEEAKGVVIEELKEFSYHYYMDNLKLQLEGKRRRALPCYSGYTSLVLDPWGNVLPCVLRSETFGNIRERPLKEILYSPKARRIKERIKNCTCWSQCEVSTSASVDPFDVWRWFLRCSDKREFLRKLETKESKL